MAKITIMAQEDVAPASALKGFSGAGKSFAYLSGEQDPIHVYLHRLSEGESVRIGPRNTPSSVFVWEGGIDAGGHELSKGSSLMVERGATFELRSFAPDTVLFDFASSRAADAPAVEHPQVHLLASEQAPRYQEGLERGAIAGVLHADASLPTCSIWLHENKLAPPAPDAPRADPDIAVHSHAEDEVIIVTAGQMQLGARRLGPGSMIAIAAETMYSFGVGPEGLSFVNFRAGRPNQIRFKNGTMIDEVGYWRTRAGQPRYISLDGARSAH